MLLSQVRLEAEKRPLDVLVREGRVAAIDPDLRAASTEIIDGGGHALIPGLHDHHIHLLATAAADRSVMCGPPTVTTRAGLAEALRAAAPRIGWVRGVGWDEVATGELDRWALDDLRGDVPVRVQHRGGSLWVLNSAALDALGPDALNHEGIERDGSGELTGRLWRADTVLRGLPDDPVELGPLSRRLASYGITGVTDATPDLDRATVAALTGPGMLQRVVLLGAPGAAPEKIVVSDHALPTFDDLAARISGSRPRTVAVHCVSREALLLTLAVILDIGAVAGDRLEHAAVVPPGTAEVIASLGLAVVTQPSLVARRGDEYLDHVAPEDLCGLWPFASLDAAGVGLGCSSDAPYGDPDPWVTIRAAVERRAPSGRQVASHEAVSARRALRGFLTDPLDPGGAPRTIAVGAPADLVLLNRSLEDALADPTSEAVRLTLIAGEPVG